MASAEQRTAIRCQSAFCALKLAGVRTDVGGVRVVLVLVLASAPAWSGQGWKKRWIASAVGLAAASLVDARSSLGRYEGNPLLRNERGQFAAGRGIAMKAGATGGMVVIQGILARRRPELYKPSSLVNLGAAGAFGVAAWRNGSR